MVRRLSMGQITRSRYLKVSFYLLVLFMGITPSSAQTFQTALTGNIGLGYQLQEKNIYDPGFSGAGWHFEQIHSLDSSRLSVINGLDFSYTGWGTQLLIRNGIDLLVANIDLKGKRKDHPDNKRIRLNIRLLTMNGLALTRPKMLYAGAIEVSPVITFQANKHTGYFLATGLRYSFSPGYRDYGSIWSYSDIPISLGIRRTFN